MDALGMGPVAYEAPELSVKAVNVARRLRGGQPLI